VNELKVSLHQAQAMAQEAEKRVAEQHSEIIALVYFHTSL